MKSKISDLFDQISKRKQQDELENELRKMEQEYYESIIGNINNIGGISSQTIHNPYIPYPIGTPSIGTFTGTPMATTTWPSVNPQYPNNAGYLVPAFKWALPIEFPRGFFSLGEKFVPVMTCDNSFAFMFHVSVWKACCKPEKKEYGVIWDEQGHGVNKGTLLIREGKALEAFNEWWESYSSRYEGNEWQNNQLPQIHESIEISGYPIRHNQKLGSLYGMPTVTDDLFDRWVWIVQNTEDKVLFTEDYWIFKDKGELIMYKLTLDIHTEKNNDE
jgi:hypothetical protein